MLPSAGLVNDALATVQSGGIVTVERGEHYLMELQWDDGVETREQSFQPDLPVSFRS